MNQRLRRLHPLIATAALLGAALVLAGHTLLWSAELPSEATLPGQKPLAKPAPQVVLPDQVAAPPAAAPAPAKPRATVAPEGRTAGSVPGAELPSEATLPRPVAVAEVLAPRVLPSEATLPVAQQPPADAAIGQRPPGQPWLRLNFNGSTATIRALVFTEDAARLCAAGEDKEVHVWVRAAEVVARGGWIHERTIRWQVQRGDRGRIYALAAAPSLLALAGHGAMGGLGEILLVDPATGQLSRALVDDQAGHRQVVAGLAFVSEPQQRPADAERGPARPQVFRLVSADVQGQVMAWQRDPASGLWSGTKLSDTDRQTHGAATAAALAPWRRFVPVTMAGPDWVVVPSLAEPPTAERPPLWRLQRLRFGGAERQDLGDAIHGGMVTALAASRDGTRLVSADARTRGRLHFWSLGQAVRVQTQELQAPVISLAFSPDGGHVLAGTMPSPLLQNQALVQLWDLRDADNPQLRFEQRVAQPVYAVAISPDGQTLAYSQGNGVVVAGLADPQAAPRTLRPPLEPPLKVAFARREPWYRVAFGTRRAADGTVPLEQVFDTRLVQLGRDKALEPAEWRPAAPAQGGWTLVADRGPDGQAVQATYRLQRNGQWKGRLPLVPELHGEPVCRCWIPNPQPPHAPYAVAVGTNGRNNVYVFQLAETGDCPLLRQFRGHSAEVTSVDVSHDARYLVTGSADATVAIWKLEDFASADTLVNRWGATFEVQGQQLVAATVREDGPLYFRGLRAGDVIRSVQWVADGQPQKAAAPAAILQTLREVPWDTLVAFESARRDLDQPLFQIFPAWQQVVSLFVSEDRQWAYWTPAGYYDASFDGHKLFGWQINRGVDALPDFFLAAQFRKALEQPAVMEKLLEAGSLEEAFRATRREPPAHAEEVVMDEYRLKPRVVILEPASGATLAGSRATLRAAITVRRGQELAPPKAFANGVVAPPARLEAERPVPGGRELIYAWDAPLPSDPRLLIQVVAATEAEAAEFQSVTVTHRVPASRPRGRLFIVAAGINQYQDAQIPRLEFAVNNARGLVAVLRQGTAGWYDSDAVTLLDRNATRSLWHVVAEEQAAALQDQVTADDLLVIFLSGHGVYDAGSEQYYFVAANAQYADLRADRYADCLSLADFRPFAGLPCRKLVILDTCHSGAVQPLRQQHLKAALRALQDDVVFTLTASEGSQEAVEERERQLGRFTARLLDALRGAADPLAAGGDGDGRVTWNEVVGYVKRAVTEDSAAEALRQYPTAGPIELLDYAQMPLTAAQP